ncbi:hypothetical protein Glove_90g8 [Diversispora epigaea]|uniref:Uncharacterized protein n=1 Tax=Diversispora epigaea TaxID=1348612 RepID=A0A397JEI0_9GLOM|nr:hypothetical protein Glove_90g8 [Diversispora epigaea]
MNRNGLQGVNETYVNEDTSSNKNSKKRKRSSPTPDIPKLNRDVSINNMLTELDLGEEIVVASSSRLYINDQFHELHMDEMLDIFDDELLFDIEDDDNELIDDLEECDNEEIIYDDDELEVEVELENEYIDSDDEVFKDDD